MTTIARTACLLIMCHGFALGDFGGAGWCPSIVKEAPPSLSGAPFVCPVEAARFRVEEDGLPSADASDFATRVGGFITEHPVETDSPTASALWSVQAVASRQCKCLAYLSGPQRDRRSEIIQLCLIQADILHWRLALRSGHHGQSDRAFCATVGALVCTAGALRDASPVGSVAHEVATQWLRTALGQWATYGDKKGNKEDRAAARAMIDAIHVDPGLTELHGSDEEFFRQLDTSRSDMAEVRGPVAARDWKAAREAYIQVLARRFSPERGWPDINMRKTFSLDEANDNCRNVFILQAHMYRRYDFGQKVDWSLVVDNDVESRVWMNAHPWMWTLLNAYQSTHDEKYVEHLCRLFNSWYESSPPPFTRSNAQWRTLEAGGRPGQRWGLILLSLANHPEFRQRCLFNMARSALDHGKYLCMYAAGGGNWLQVESSGLIVVALLFPEFRLSGLFYEVGMRRLEWVNARAFLPDGFQSECAPLYHRFPLSSMAAALRLAAFLKAPIPEGMMRQYEAGVEALEYISYPDGVLPILSDGSPHRISILEVMQSGAGVFGRDDFRWFSTSGREGKPPARPSHDFTHAGFCVMRDRWGPDAQVLIFDAGYFGAGHQHEDKLNFVLYGGGRELIGDPGIYSYKGDEFEPYWRGSWSHNTVMIDNLSQHRALGPSEGMPDPDRRFVIGGMHDFAAGWYRRAYSPRGSQVWEGKRGKADKGRSAAVRTVQHQRCIFFLKGQYAVLCDRVVGAGRHQVDILFHPAPIVTVQGDKTTVRAVKLDVEQGRTITREPDHANVAILPAQLQGCEVLDLIAQKSPVRGWYSLYGIQPSHDIVYRCQAELPFHFETVVQPLPQGKVSPMVVTSRPVTAEPGKVCAGLACGGDLFLISYDGPADMTAGEVRFRGTAVLLSRQAGKWRQAHMIDGERLILGGQEVFSASAPAASQSLLLK